MIVGKIIKEIRENAGLSQEQFAEKLSISRQAVSKWERGVALPDIENIMYIREEFGPAIALIAVSFLYAGIINLVIVIPYKIIIKKKINEMEN